MVFSGTINVNSGESPDGTLLIGRIFDSNDKILYTSNSVKVSGNKYVALTLGPMESVAVGKLIKFYFMCAEIPCTDAAAETINYASAKVKFRYSLTFNKVPPTQSELDAAANAKADAQSEIAGKLYGIKQTIEVLEANGEANTTIIATNLVNKRN